MTDPTYSGRRLPARSAFLQTRHSARPVLVLEEDPVIPPEQLPETPSPAADGKPAGLSPHPK